VDRAHFEDLMSSFYLMAQQNILRDGHLTPVVLVVKGDKTAVIVLEYQSDEEKAAAFARVNFVLRRLKPDAAINIAEAWMVKADTGKDIETVAPSEHPLRVECIIVAGMADFLSSLKLGEVIRDGTGKIADVKEQDLSYPGGSAYIKIFEGVFETQFSETAAA